MRTPLHISLNAQQSLPVTVSFYAEPSIALLSPTSGPILGDTLVTINGSALPSEALTGVCLCQIGTHIADGTRMGPDMMRCRTPTLHQAGDNPRVVQHAFDAWGGSADLGNDL